MAATGLAQALDEIDRLLRSEVCGDGVSVAQMAERTGKSVSSIRTWLRGEIQAGRWQHAGRIPMTSMDGKQSWTPVYRPVEKK